MAIPRFLIVALTLLLPAVLLATEPAPGTNQFGWTAYRELAKSKKGNLIFSPFNIAAALSMALEGARGKTAEEISSVLHRVQNDPNYAAALSALVKELTGSANSGGNQLSTANALWVQRGFAILPDFQRVLAGPYGAPMQELDFSRNPEQARQQVNSWTERETKGKIRDLFASGSLSRDTRLVLTSAIYFYGKWQAPFAAKNTRPAPFRTAGGPVQTDFMNRSGSYLYGETADAQMLELKYAGSPLAFDVILPKGDNGLPAIEASITADDLARRLATLRSRTVDVMLPKFRAESEFSLRETLSRMGMPSAFGSADFSGITGRPDLRISDVVHKAFVDVTEEGTEAAAAAGIGFTRVSVPEPNKAFRADHPFVFLIRDTKSGVVLFSGRLLTPKS